MKNPNFKQRNSYSKSKSNAIFNCNIEVDFKRSFNEIENNKKNCKLTEEEYLPHFANKTIEEPKLYDSHNKQNKHDCLNNELNKYHVNKSINILNNKKDNLFSNNTNGNLINTEDNEKYLIKKIEEINNRNFTNRNIDNKKIDKELLKTFSNTIDVNENSQIIINNCNFSNFNKKNLIPENKILRKSNKPSLNNISMNLTNNNNNLMLLTCNNKNSFNYNPIRTTTTNNNNSKNSFNNSNFLGINTVNLSSKPALPTIIKSSFIMSGIENNKNVEGKGNYDEELHNILSNQKDNLTNRITNNTMNNNILLTNKELKYEFNPEILRTSNLKNSNLSKSKTIIPKKIFGGFNYNTSQITNNSIYSKKNHESLYLLTDSQNTYLNDMQKINKNRSVIIKNLNFKNCSNKYKIKRPKSQNLFEIQNYRNDLNINFNHLSIERKVKFENLQGKNYNDTIYDKKLFNIIDLKKKYNEVVKKKKLPTSILIKSIKSGTDKRNNYTSFNNYSLNEKNFISENYLNNANGNNNNNNSFKTLLRPVKNNSLYLNQKKTINNHSLYNKEMNIIEYSNSNIKIKLGSEISEANNNLKNHNLITKENKSNIYKSNNNEIRTFSKEKKFNAMSTLEGNSNAKYKSNNKNYKENFEKKNIKNLDNNSNLKNRVYNNDNKNSKNLLNSKNNLVKSHLNMNRTKNRKSIINIYPRDLIDFNSDNEYEKKVFDDFEKVLIYNEKKIGKRLRLKNKSFANGNFNWMNLITNNKSLNKGIKNTNKRDNNSKKNNLDFLTKLQLRNYETELLNQTTKNLNKKNLPFDLNNINPINDKENKELDSKNKINNKNNNTNLNEVIQNDISKNIIKNFNKSLVNNTNYLLNELRSYLKNKKLEYTSSENLSKNYNNTIDTTIKPSSGEENKGKNNYEIENINVNQFYLAEENIRNIDITNTNNSFSNLLNSSKEKKDFNNSPNKKHNLITDNIKKSNIINNNNNIKILENDYDSEIDNSRYNTSNKNEEDILYNKIEYDNAQKNLNEESNLINAYVDQLYNKNNLNISDSKYSQINESVNNKTDIIDNNYNLESKESIGNYYNKNKSFSICSQYADDIENMNSIIRRLDFAKNNKNEDSIFNLENKLYKNFELKFKNEIENIIFPKKLII